MYHSGALIVNSGKLLLPALTAAARLVTGVLYIPLAQGLTNVVQSTTGLSNTHDDSQILESEFLQQSSEQINQVYMHIAKCSPLLDVRFLLPNFPHPQPQTPMSVFPLQHSVDVLLSPASSLKEVKTSPAYHLLNQRLKSDLQLEFQQIDIRSDGHNHLQVSTKSSPPSMQSYGDVALGGTFDGIHDGHRLLLTQSALITTSRILVGIANGPLLASKVLPELIKPVKERIFEVKSLLADIKPWIQHQVEEIVDVYGPTAWDEGLVCLVVTPDTARGGEKVNAERKRKGLRQLSVCVVGLVGAEEPSAEGKLSSSDIRKSLLGSYRNVAGSRCLTTYDQSTGPYLIGLTGGIACGKTSIYNRIAKLGAFPIDCDKLGHKSYEPGMAAYKKIIEEFGEAILDESGQINRKVLGPIVFSDKKGCFNPAEVAAVIFEQLPAAIGTELVSRASPMHRTTTESVRGTVAIYLEKSKLAKLNEIVWPEIWKLVQEKIVEAHSQGFGVCVVDAAVMLKAGWDKHVHEIWVAITPEKEALRRVMERDKLSEEAAHKRMEAQMTNAEYVRQANVVFSTQWEPEYTQKQVEKAWKELQTRIAMHM